MEEAKAKKNRTYWKIPKTGDVNVSHIAGVYIYIDLILYNDAFIYLCFTCIYL